MYVKGIEKVCFMSALIISRRKSFPDVTLLCQRKKNLLYTNKKGNIQMDSKEVLFKSNNGTM